MGRTQESAKEIRIAQALDPLSLLVNTETAWNLYMAREFEAAVEQSWKTLTLEPRFAAAQHTLGLAYEQMGMIDEATTELQNARLCSGGQLAILAALGHVYASCGYHHEAGAVIREIDALERHRYVSPYWRAIIHAGFGYVDEAFASLEKALDERDVWLVWMKVEPRLDVLRADRRFDELLERIGLGSSESKLMRAASV
jgi:serine/threonine-protein kinase